MVLQAVVNRLPVVPLPLIRALAVVTVVGQAGIAVTGAVVRVTGSGLGCPTWPECFPGSLVPTPHPEVAALNQWIEFGNRLLTIALVLAAGLTMLAVLTIRPRRRRLVWLAVAQPVGILAQAVIGGFVVLSGLVWWSVAVHFLVSMVFTWLAVQLVVAVSDGGGPARSIVPGAVRGLVATSTAVLAALLVAGTLVTAAGPHAGDAATPRLGIEVAALAQLHADLLFGYLGLLIGLGFTLRATSAPRVVHRRYAVLVAVVLAQGALGGTQYALGVPEVLAALHVLGAGLVTVAAASMWAGLTERPALPAPAGSGSGGTGEPVPVGEPVLTEGARSGA
ncbi:COX15/CtaA family protein [Pseudonocardia humida]|uniref:Heme A synthase n=1 Tax=Pseudonocardia humida TaxID=2800819 RepID=A0ABT1A729_9PSEU|nr:COX15/CtaA family protein [Pseudonocardia humida]MCO1658822.1 heme A synthase [Pseudonocardia humida]